MILAVQRVIWGGRCEADQRPSEAPGLTNQTLLPELLSAAEARKLR